MINSLGNSLPKKSAPKQRSFEDFAESDWENFFRSIQRKDDIRKALAYFTRFALEPQNHKKALSFIDIAVQRKLPNYLLKQIDTVKVRILDRIENPDIGDYEHPMFKGERTLTTKELSARLKAIHAKQDDGLGSTKLVS